MSVNLAPGMVFIILAQHFFAGQTFNVCNLLVVYGIKLHCFVWRALYCQFGIMKVCIYWVPYLFTTFVIKEESK